MIAVDTSVLLRYLLQDDEVQAVRADAVFDAAETVLVTDIVLVETVWTLSGRKYRLTKHDDLAAVLARQFSEPNIRSEDDRVVWRALQAHRGAASVEDGEAGLASGGGFADALIVYKALRTASETREVLNAVYTFDAAMQRLRHAAPPQEGSGEGREQRSAQVVSLFAAGWHGVGHDRRRRRRARKSTRSGDEHSICLVTVVRSLPLARCFPPTRAACHRPAR